MSAEVTKAHREAALLVMFPVYGPNSWLKKWAEFGDVGEEGDQFPTARVAQALADAEQSGREAERAEVAEQLASAIEEQRLYFAAKEDLEEWQRDVRRAVRNGLSGFEALEQANVNQFARNATTIESGEHLARGSR